MIFLELKINQLEIKSGIRDKFLMFSESRKLENNTESKLDCSYELEKSTSLEKEP